MPANKRSGVFPTFGEERMKKQNISGLQQGPLSFAPLCFAGEILPLASSYNLSVTIPASSVQLPLCDEVIRLWVVTRQRVVHVIRKQLPAPWEYLLGKGICGYAVGGGQLRNSRGDCSQCQRRTIHGGRQLLCPPKLRKISHLVYEMILFRDSNSV